MPPGPPACALRRAAPRRRPRRPLAAPLGVAAHRATGCRRSSSSGGWHPAAPRLRRCGGGCGGVRRSIAPLRRAAPSAGVQRGGQGGRQLARLRVRLLLPRQPRWRPVGFGCARRPAARGCGWLRAVRRCSARRAAARPAARTACCAGGCGCASCCSPAPPVARRRQLRCDARPRFGRAAGGGRATRRTHARRAAASSALARARARLRKRRYAAADVAAAPGSGRSMWQARPKHAPGGPRDGGCTRRRRDLESVRANWRPLRMTGHPELADRPPRVARPLARFSQTSIPFCPNLPRGKKAENQQCTRCLLLLSLLPSSAAAGHAGHGIGVRGDQPEAHGDVGLGEVRQARR
jgi:hypothetical protein